MNLQTDHGVVNRGKRNRSKMVTNNTILSSPSHTATTKNCATIALYAKWAEEDARMTEAERLENDRIYDELERTGFADRLQLHHEFADIDVIYDHPRTIGDLANEQRIFQASLPTQLVDVDLP